MKAYGIPRHPDIDEAEFAPQSSAWKLSGKGGDIHSIFRSSASKRQTRRYWKRAARREGKSACLALD